MKKLLFVVGLVWLISRAGHLEETSKMITDMTKPRGVRANNPLNIELSTANDWQGKVTPSVDSRFETFSAPQYGFRAGAKTLRTYQSRYGINTINGVIHRFAPPNENKTGNYAAFVAKQVGVGVDEVLDFFNDALLAKVLHAMSVMEVGRGWYTLDDAKAGVALA